MIHKIIIVVLVVIIIIGAFVYMKNNSDKKTEAQNKALVQKFVDIKNTRKLDTLGDVFASDYVEHNPAVASFGKGVEGYKKFLGYLFSGYPDDKVTVELITADGDMVSYRASETGTNKGEFLGIPATNKTATWTEIHFFKFKDGKVVEHWVDPDIYSWFQQIGVIPANR